MKLVFVQAAFVLVLGLTLEMSKSGPNNENIQSRKLKVQNVYQ